MGHKNKIWINKISIYVWFVKIEAYLVDILLFKTLEFEKI